MFYYLFHKPQQPMLRKIKKQRHVRYLLSQAAIVTPSEPLDIELQEPIATPSEPLDKGLQEPIATPLEPLDKGLQEPLDDRMLYNLFHMPQQPIPSRLRKIKKHRHLRSLQNSLRKQGRHVLRSQGAIVTPSEPLDDDDLISDVEIEVLEKPPVKEHSKRKRQLKVKDSDDDDGDFYPLGEGCFSDDDDVNTDTASIATTPPPSKKLMTLGKLKKQHNILRQQISTEALKTRFWNELQLEGFENFFNARWIVNNSSLSTLIFRIQDFLVFLHSKLSTPEISVVEMLTDFLRDGIEKYDEYMLQLKNLQQLSPYNLRNYAKDIIKFLEWFVVIKKKNKNAKVKKVRPHHWELFLKMTKQIMKSIKKEIRTKQSEHCVEAMIERNEWPPGGLLELQNAIRNDMYWVRNMAQANEGPTNKTVYNKYMNLLSASIYCFSCQGRVGGIEDLKFYQGKELLEEGVVLTSKFKTNAKFGYQPVTLPGDKVSTFLLHFYLTNVRPMSLQGRDDPLFINFNGTGKYNIAKGLSNFFALSLGLKITSTRIRSIVETCFEDLLDDGTISKVQRHAIQNVNGHDGQTMKDYYLKKSRRQDAKNAFDAFDIYDEVNGINNFDSSANLENFPAMIDMDLENDLMDEMESNMDCLNNLVEGDKSHDASLPITGIVGCKHPEFNKSENQMRATWTDFEIEKVGKWCE